MVKSMDDHGRLIVICGTAAGNVVVFKRFVEENNSVVVCNAPTALLQMLDIDGSLKSDDVERLLGNGWMPNIGVLLGNLVKVVALQDKLAT